MIVKSPKAYTPPHGISPTSVLLKGPKDWTDILSDVIEKKYPAVTILVSNDEKLTEWDIDIALSTECIALNFRSMNSNVMTMFGLAELARFRPLCYLFVDGRNKDEALITKLAELSKWKITTLNEIEKDLLEYFDYLNFDPLTDGALPATMKVRKKRVKKTI